MIVWPAKDPVEELDYSWDVPLDGSDTIASFTAAVSSGTIVKGDDGKTDTRVTVWFTGGVADELATVNLTATTTGGRTFREVAVLPIIDRASQMLAMFRLRYPGFVAASDGQIGYWLADAGKQVGTSWIEATRDDAKLAWAAHQLIANGIVKVAGAIPAGVTSFKSGTFSAQVSDAVAAQQGLDATIYGREFKRLQRVNFGGPRLAWNPPVPCDV